MLKLYLSLLFISALAANCYALWLPIQLGTINNLKSLTLTDKQTAGTTLAAPVLHSPSAGFYTADLDITLRWQEIEKTEFYHLQIAADSSFNSNLVNNSTLNTTEYHFTDLEYEKTYYWRVRANSILGTSPWSEVFHFSTIDLGPLLSTPLDGDNIITIQPILCWQAKNGASKFETLQGFKVGWIIPIHKRTPKEFYYY